ANPSSSPSLPLRENCSPSSMRSCEINPHGSSKTLDQKDSRSPRTRREVKKRKLRRLFHLGPREIGIILPHHAVDIGDKIAERLDLAAQFGCKERRQDAAKRAERGG